MPEIIAKRFFKCDCGPNGDEFLVEHLFERNRPAFGPWYCDNCGHTWYGTMDDKGGLNLKKSDGPAQKRIGVMLRLKDGFKAQDLSFLARARVFRDKANSQWADHESTREYFEEDICPENVASLVERIFLGKENDCHGLFEVVSICDDPMPDESIDSDAYQEYIRDNFPDVFSNGECRGFGKALPLRLVPMEGLF
jgi:hypothetical protein